MRVEQIQCDGCGKVMEDGEQESSTPINSVGIELYPTDSLPMSDMLQDLEFCDGCASKFIESVKKCAAYLVAQFKEESLG